MHVPKDYKVAEAAYNTFYRNNPQVPFEGLSHEYKMRWVEIARVVIEIHDTFKRSPESIEKQKITMRANKVDRQLGIKKPSKKGKFKGSEEQRRIWREAKAAQIARQKANGADAS